jgi:hypothetical protein
MKDTKTLVIEALNGQTEDGEAIVVKTCLKNLKSLIPKLLVKIKEADDKVAELAKYIIHNRDQHKEWEGYAEEWHELFNRAEIKLEKHVKCPYCGGKMKPMCFPRYSMSDWINDQCEGISEGRPHVRCNAHRSGPLKGEVKWYSPEEWEDHVNIIDGVDSRVEMRKRAEA